MQHFRLIDFVLATTAVCSLVAAQRKVTVSYNPGCNISACYNASLSVHLIYARSQASDGCQHYLFSTIGSASPTLLLLQSEYNSSRVLIDWNALLSIPLNISDLQGAISLVDGEGQLLPTSPVGAVYALYQLLEYRDVADNVNISDPKNTIVSRIFMSDMTWNVTNKSNAVHFMGTSENNSKSFRNRSLIEVKFTFFDVNGRGASLPRLAYSDRSATLEFIINNLTVNNTNSRFSLIVLVSNPENSSLSQPQFGDGGVVEKVSIKTIDDEYAPSVFTTTKILWRNSDKKQTNNFWNWRTVCYTWPISTRKNSTDVRSTSLHSVNKTVAPSLYLKNRLLLAYYGQTGVEDMNFYGSLVSFGKTEDGNYIATNYSSWTSLVGFSSAPLDSFSKLVYGILFVGVCLPLLVIVGGGMFLLIRKLRGGSSLSLSKSDYEPIG